MADALSWRRLPGGAEVAPRGGVHFRVWAPEKKTVEVVIDRDGGRHEIVTLDAEAGGWFAGHAAAATAGTRYGYRVDGEGRFPDPWSRYQPEGPHGPSEVIDPGGYHWNDRAWRGATPRGQVMYEMHVGTFTAEGTYAAAARDLPFLRDLGVTMIEVMPIADFAGRFGWGYDGVNLFAPYRMYGRPDELRAFVDEAHGVGLAVILDVVYNHLGPDGNYLSRFTPSWMSARHKSEWGDSLNFDGDGCDVVRDAVTANAAYWIAEFHLDGLRLDATQQVYDDSAEHILAAVTRAAREAAGTRPIVITAENEPQDVRLLACDGVDAMWNDDFHHTATVALAGRTEAYRTDYRGSPQEFISAAKHGFLYQGQRYEWQDGPRGTPALAFGADRFVHYLANHDQTANAPNSARVHQLASPARWRAMVGLLLLGPQTPLLFQGQEFESSAPFYFFADHAEELARQVHKGRAEFVSQMPSLASAPMQTLLPDPADPATFAACKLDHAERAAHQHAVRLHRDLITLRREDPVLGNGAPLDGAVLTPTAFALRFFAPDGADRLLIVNLGPDHDLIPAPEPLLAGPLNHWWSIAWCSEHPDYGGRGYPDLPSDGRWHLVGESTSLLVPRPGRVPKHGRRGGGAA